MNTPETNDIVEKNKPVLDEIKQSDETCCFDISMLTTHEGRCIVGELRRLLGSRRLFVDAKTVEKIGQRADSDIARKFLEETLNVRVANGPMHYLITKDINLAEYVSRRTSESRVYILNNLNQFRSWKEERSENMTRALSALGDKLTSYSCWGTSSALASERILRLAENIERLPESTRTRFHMLDVSAHKASKKNQRVATAIQKLKTLCSNQTVGAAFPSAHESTLLAMLIIYAAKNETLVTIWNDAEQANRVWDIVEKHPEGHDKLRNVAFYELSWYGKLVPLKNFTRNNLAREIEHSGQEETNVQAQKEARQPSLFEIANYLKIDTTDAIVKLMEIEPGHITNPNDLLSQEKVNFLCTQFPVPEPDETIRRTTGPILGKLVAQKPLEEILDSVDGDSIKAELAIIYARRWEKADVLEALIERADLLSPYCFNEWFKRSQNAKHSMSLEDLLLNSTYYSLLLKVIDKTPHFSGSDDAVAKLQLMESSAIVAEVKKRATHVLGRIRNKGAIIPDKGSR